MAEQQPTDIACVEGRKPWWTDSTGVTKKPLLIGVCGMTCSRKTQLCKEIVSNLEIEWVATVRLDSFYRPLTPDQISKGILSAVNFDCPQAFDFEAARKVLTDLQAGKRVEIPMYDFRKNALSSGKKTIYGVDVVIFEGLLALWDENIRNLMDIKLFCESEPDMTLSRRLDRDVHQRGRNVSDVLMQYERFVKPGAEKYVLPQKLWADILLPSSSDTKVVVDLLCKKALKMLSERGWTQLITPSITTDILPANIHILSPTPMIRAMQTIVRDKNTSHEDFVHYSDRLCSLLVENALSLLPYDRAIVTTPTGSCYEGEKFKVNLCGVSLMRNGSSMEAPLRRICKGIRIGKILIQSDDQKCPSLLYVKLPKVISGRHVLLLDPLLISGATATMAIHILLDHGVKENEIHFCVHVASLQGLHMVARRFPGVDIVCGLIDKTSISSETFLANGIGYTPERYFW